MLWPFLLTAFARRKNHLKSQGRSSPGATEYNLPPARIPPPGDILLETESLLLAEELYPVSYTVDVSAKYSLVVRRSERSCGDKPL